MGYHLDVNTMVHATGNDRVFSLSQMEVGLKTSFSLAVSQDNKHTIYGMKGLF